MQTQQQARPQTQQAGKTLKPWSHFVLMGLLFFFVTALLFILCVWNPPFMADFFEGSINNLLLAFLLIYCCFALGLINLARGLSMLWNYALIGYPLAVSSLLLFLSLIIPSLRAHTYFLLAILFPGLNLSFYPLLAILFIIPAFPTGIVLLIKDRQAVRQAPLPPI